MLVAFVTIVGWSNATRVTPLVERTSRMKASAPSKDTSRGGCQPTAFPSCRETAAIAPGAFRLSVQAESKATNVSTVCGRPRRDLYLQQTQPAAAFDPVYTLIRSTSSRLMASRRRS